MDNINETEVLEPKKKKAKFYLPISALVVYLMVASFLATGVNFSKYISGTNGQDSARLAKFDVTSTRDDTNLTSGLYVDAHYYDVRTATYNFTVQSTSEVAVNYKIEVLNVPVGLLVSLDGREAVEPTNVVDGVGEVIYTNETGGYDILSIGDNSVKSHKIVFSPKTKESIPTTYLETVVRVTAFQID